MEGGVKFLIKLISLSLFSLAQLSHSVNGDDDEVFNEAETLCT